jgi:hypothetical protein
VAVFDTEELLDSVRTILQANMATKLSDIDTEKADGLILDDIPTAGYFINTIPPSLNVNPFLIYGVQAVTPISSGPTVALAYSLFIIIGHAGLRNEVNDDIQRKLLRYSRAVKEIMAEKFDSISPGFSKIEVEEFPANPEIELNNNEILRVSGLVFSATIA